MHKWLPTWAFTVLTVGVLIGGIFLAHLWSFMRHFQEPDTALAWIALLLAMLLVFQQTTNYSHGVVYMLMGARDRAEVDRRAKHLEDRKKQPVAARSQLGRTMKIAYWPCVVLLLLMSASLFIGTFRNPTDAVVQQVIKSNRETVTQLVESNRELAAKIDRLITQMEIDNAARNAASNK